MPKLEDVLIIALERIVGLEGSERDEWDAVDRLIPEMCHTAREALLAYRIEVEGADNVQA